MLKACPSLGLSHRAPVGALTVDSADFDGVNDYLSRAQFSGGLTDSKKGLLSFWFRVDGGAGQLNCVFMNKSPGVGGFPSIAAIIGSAGELSIQGTAGGSPLSLELLYLESTTHFTPSAAWHHAAVSWDLGAGLAHLYIDGADDLKTSNDVVVDGAIEYSDNTNWYVGSNMGGSATEQMDGCLAEFYFAVGEYLDLRRPQVMRRLRTAAGKPAFLGADGRLPTGVVPHVYLHLDDGETANNFATNRGSGGNFTLTGALSTGSTSPSD